MSESLSSDSSSSTSDEAASDPPSEEEPKAPAKVAEKGAAAPSSKPRHLKDQKVKVKKEKKEKKREREEVEQFVPSIESLQGRWRHSVNSLGMLSVKGNVVSFSDGTRYVLTEISPGRIDMGGWQTIASKCTPEVIVWMFEGDVATTVNWLLEEDADDNTLEGLDSRNILQGKRRRAKVDYAALEKQIETEERQYEDVFSDASSSSGGGAKRKTVPAKAPVKEDSVEMTPKEWAEHHAKQSKKAAGLFRQWMLSTCTSRHEEILRRKGKLQTRIPVILIGPGRRLLEQELIPYSAKCRFHAQETMVVVDMNSRQKFQERHAADWAASLEHFKGLEKRKAAEKRQREDQAAAAPVPRVAPVPNLRPEVKRRPAELAAAQAKPPAEVQAEPAEPTEPEAEADAGSTPKRRRLRRVVASDDEDAEADAGEAETTAAAVPQEARPESIMEVKQKLEASPSPEEVTQALTYLESQSVDHTILMSTKIGVTVNSLRKTYAQHPDVARHAQALVKRWRDVWEQYQTQKRNS